MTRGAQSDGDSNGGGGCEDYDLKWCWAQSRAAAKPPKPAARHMSTQTEQTAGQEPATRTAAGLPGGSPPVTHDMSTQTGQAAGRGGGVTPGSARATIPVRGSPSTVRGKTFTASTFFPEFFVDAADCAGMMQQDAW